MYGSPPQVRGKQRIEFFTRILYEDHPRRCGENRPIQECHFQLQGSPPQVRGKLDARIDHIAEPRITPAGAGKTFRNVIIEDLLTDHPRRCGENEITTCFLMMK